MESSLLRGLSTQKTVLLPDGVADNTRPKDSIIPVNMQARYCQPGENQVYRRKKRIFYWKIKGNRIFATLKTPEEVYIC
jgi:hypothetical protein